MVTGARCLVFTGPTLPKDEVLELLPHATVRPPIAGGDLWQVEPAPGDTVVIIDGYYFQTLAIRHKEIAALCDNGVRVVGTASMGALRAAELAPFGMIGVGTVYDWYRTGAIDGDDEIAVVHSGDDTGFRSHTIALVNLRSTLCAAVAAGACDAGFATAVVGSVRQMPFTRRTRPDIMAAVTDAIGAEAGGQLREIVDRHYVDQKRADALETLRLIGQDALPAASTMLDPHLASTDVTRLTPYMRWRYEEDGPQVDGLRLTDSDVVETARIFGSDYPRLQRLASVSAVFRDLREADADDPRWAGLDAVMDRAHGAGFREEDLPIVAAAIRCQMRRHGMGGSPAGTERVLAAWLAPTELQGMTEPQRLVRFVSRSITGWGPHDGLTALESMKRRGSHDRVVRLAARIARFNDSVQRIRPGFDTRRVSVQAARQWCQKRWQDGPEPAVDWEFALMDRGFQDENDWFAAMSRLYPFAKLRGAAISLRLLPGPE